MGVHAEAGPGVDLDDRRRRCSRTERVMSGAMKSMPATSRPTTIAACRAISALSGWISSVRSIAVPPVLMLPVSLQLDDAARLRARHRASSPPRPAVSTVCSSTRDAGQHLLVADAAPGIGVGDLDQLGDRVRAVADDVGRHPLGDRDDLIVDDQDAVVLAGDEASRPRRAGAALVVGDREEARAPRPRREVDAYAAAVIAVERLEHDRVADPRARRRPPRRRCAPIAGARHGDADLVQEALVSSLLPAMSTRCPRWRW